MFLEADRRQGVDGPAGIDDPLNLSVSAFVTVMHVSHKVKEDLFTTFHTARGSVSTVA